MTLKVNDDKRLLFCRLHRLRTPVCCGSPDPSAIQRRRIESKQVATTRVLCTFATTEAIFICGA